MKSPQTRGARWEYHQSRGGEGGRGSGYLAFLGNGAWLGHDEEGEGEKTESVGSTHFNVKLCPILGGSVTAFEARLLTVKPPIFALP